MINYNMLSCIMNVSEGTRSSLLEEIVKSAGPSLLDVHSDPWHNRSVFSLAGTDVVDAAQKVARSACALLDLGEHTGVHPRLGVIDVVPFVPLASYHRQWQWDLDEALGARHAFTTFASRQLDLPCFLYGPERSLPEVRRGAFRQFDPDLGPKAPHPTAGACCVGARPVLVAYNVWLEDPNLADAQAIVRAIRSPVLRCLAFVVGDSVQISCNLVAPWIIGPMEAFDAVSAHTGVQRGELVGLLPADLLGAIPMARWRQLGLSEDSTIEARLAQQA